MPALDGFRVAPPTGPLDPADLIRCELLACTLLAGRCVDRHVARWPSGNRRGAPRWPVCAACPAGAALRARLSGYVPHPDTQPAEVMCNAQRLAKARWALSRLGVGDVERDPLAEAALMTPDDPEVATCGA